MLRVLALNIAIDRHTGGGLNSLIATGSLTADALQGRAET